MAKDKILAKAQSENKGMDIADLGGNYEAIYLL